jgi:uncharacterized protein
MTDPDRVPPLPEVPPADARPMPSPCVKVCRIDAASGLCVGCRRSLAEIGAWSTMSDADKHVLWCALPGRVVGG